LFNYLLLYAGSGIDEYSYEINFDELPLSLLNEIEIQKSILLGNTFDNYDGESEDELQEDMERAEKYYNDLISKYFNYNELIDIVKNNNNKYICNKHIYSQLLKILHSNIPDFSIDKFYDKF
jgi:hypothetical protein